MKNMKLFLLSLILGVGYAASVQAGGSRADAWTMTEVETASATVFTGGGRVLKIVLSSGPSATTNADWAQLIDSVTINSTVFTGFLSSQKKSPAIVFVSTAGLTVDPAAWMAVNRPTMDYGPDGVLIDDACFLFKTGAASGEARKAFVFWRK